MHRSSTYLRLRVAMGQGTPLLKMVPPRMAGVMPGMGGGKAADASSPAASPDVCWRSRFRR